MTRSQALFYASVEDYIIADVLVSEDLKICDKIKKLEKQISEHYQAINDLQDSILGIRTKAHNKYLPEAQQLKEEANMAIELYRRAERELELKLAKARKG